MLLPICFRQYFLNIFPLCRPKQSKNHTARAFSALRPTLGAETATASKKLTQHCNSQQITPPRLALWQSKLRFLRTLRTEIYELIFVCASSYKVNSPLRGFCISSIVCSKGRFLPKTYINFVMAASVVISKAESTPALRKRCPVS